MARAWFAAGWCLPAGVWDPATVRSAWGPSHDQNGTWTMKSPTNSPGHLGGMAMASIAESVRGCIRLAPSTDALLTGGTNTRTGVWQKYSGVLAFGGIFFGVGNTNIGPFSNATFFWPASSCP